MVKWLFVIVGMLVAFSFIMALHRGLPLWDILPLLLIVLSSAIPVALPVMFTVSMALGALALSQRGVLVTRLTAVEDAAEMSILCSDKTGTLTRNALAIQHIDPEPGTSAAEVIQMACLASEEANQDPLDSAFFQHAKDAKITLPAVAKKKFRPFTPETRRTEAEVELGGETVWVAKGALATIAQLCHLSDSATQAWQAKATQAAAKGYRVLAVAAGKQSQVPQALGLAYLMDPPRADAAQVIAELHTLGIRLKMLTGDLLAVAQQMATVLGLGRIAPAAVLREKAQTKTHFLEEEDGIAEIYPEDKYTIVKSLQNSGEVVGMTGDGVNDAPALKQAEVGVAVWHSTDAARAAASVVLTEEGLAGILDVVRTGRQIHRRILVWIVNKVSRTLMKAGYVTAVFLFSGKLAISAFAMLLLVFMTDFAKIALATDNTPGSPRPETWRIRGWMRLGAVLGVLMLGESLILLALCWKFSTLGFAEAALPAFSFELLLFFGLFSLLSIRESGPFYASRPSVFLGWVLFVDAFAGVCVSRVGVGGLSPLPVSLLLVIAVWSAACTFLVNDPVKVLLIQRSGYRV